MALYQPTFGDDVATATPGSAVGVPSGTFWTPGLIIAGIAIVAIFFLMRDEKGLRRKVRLDRRGHVIRAARGARDDAKWKR